MLLYLLHTKDAWLNRLRKSKLFQQKNCAINPLFPSYNSDKLYSKSFPSYCHSPFLMVSISFYKTHTHTRNTKKKKSHTFVHTQTQKPSFLPILLCSTYWRWQFTLFFTPLCTYLRKNIRFWCIRKSKNRGYNMLIIPLYKIIRKILAARSLIWQISYP